MTRGRQGFTFVELLVVTVLGSLILAATLQILITNQRTFTANNAMVQGQQTTRMAADILFAELREVSSRGGDIVAMESDSLTVDMMRKFSYVCEVDISGSDPTVTVLDTLFANSGGLVDNVPLMLGANAFAVDDTVLIFADNDPDLDDDDVWIEGIVDVVDLTTECPQNNEGAVTMTFTGQLSDFTTDEVMVGAPVRSRLLYTFTDTVISGDTYLGRRQEDGPIVPMVGPLQSTNGYEFVYRDADGATTSTAADVRLIEVTVRTTSDVLNSLGQFVGDSITTVIYTRN